MSTALFDSKGTPVTLGRELGVGGEGSVYEVLSRPGQVAKLYNAQHRPDAMKQAKLAFMAETADAKLLQHVAWPQAVLRAGSKGGPIIGFLMPKVTEHHPIHTIYSPAHRRQERPKAGWDFLLHVARNTAAAFETIHAHGHVLGDVNQGNILVADSSQVVLIDSDSFQINARGTLHLCEVGVAHFVPPELQGISSFAGVRRTQNQDNFGLAILVFHLLFGGRHPFSGVPLVKGAGDALESDIKLFRYAYARDARKRGVSPPPRSIPITLVPDDIQEMFHVAFTERGAIGDRPIAEQWVAALDDLRGKLLKCSVTPTHVYPRHLQTCPWCVLERAGVVYFLDLRAAVHTPAGTGFVLAKVWALIEAVPAPPHVAIPRPESYAVKPTPLPRRMRLVLTVGFVRLIVVCATVATLWVILPGPWWRALTVASAGFVCFVLAGRVGRARGSKTERSARKTARDAARRAYKQLIAALESEAGASGFRAIRDKLKRLREEYEGLSQKEKSELDRLHLTARDRQLHRYLDGFFIDSASIPGVGAERKAKLRDFGIETAAHVQRQVITQIPGFGSSITQAVMDWQAKCKRGFRFDASRAGTDADRNALRAGYAARRQAIETALTGGVEELRTFRQRASSRVAELLPKAAEAAKHLAQMQCDYSVVR